MNLNNHQAMARQCAGLFRLGRDIEGGLEMVEMFDRLLRVFDAEPVAIQQQSAAILAAVFTAQQAQDWIGVADYLEYELVELLGQVGKA
ncbi:hypothetical protein [Pseudomonas akapageensis]|uniref:hypothetical protein n=1 Tax=Pseudomonas akapageensis TaxID=2609961 RepID=UPI00140BBA72|nr:hypothetical protein [Pseudomonas akapageensis]